MNRMGTWKSGGAGLAAIFDGSNHRLLPGYLTSESTWSHEVFMNPIAEMLQQSRATDSQNSLVFRFGRITTSTQVLENIQRIIMRTLATGRSSAAPQVELCATTEMNNHPAAGRYEDVLTELCYDITVP